MVISRQLPMKNYAEMTMGLGVHLNGQMFMGQPWPKNLRAPPGASGRYRADPPPAVLQISPGATGRYRALQVLVRREQGPGQWGQFGERSRAGLP